jgi:hypothetical protein
MEKIRLEKSIFVFVKKRILKLFQVTSGKEKKNKQTHTHMHICININIKLFKDVDR